MSRELAELHKANATKDSEAQELALSREVLAKEELSLALEKAQEESRLQQEALANQVNPFEFFFVKILILIVLHVIMISYYFIIISITTTFFLCFSTFV